MPKKKNAHAQALGRQRWRNIPPAERKRVMLALIRHRWAEWRKLHKNGDGP